MTTESTKGLHVIHPGILTLIQDLGRSGYQHLGLTTGGAADEHAFLWANRLLNNPPHCATLEICFGGLQLEAEVATRIAITGADLRASLNGSALQTWQTFNLRPGDRLQFASPKTGVRAYLAVQGGFQINPTFGSVATVMREHLGGLDGKGSPLRKGDRLPCSSAAAPPASYAYESAVLHKCVPPQFIPDYRQPLTLRVIEDQGNAPFDRDDLKRFYSSVYEISDQSDRMGVRLSGEPLPPKCPGIISEGVSFAAVQIPPNGQPIILLKDRQTIGGYPKLGTVFALDAFALSQRHPHTQLQFETMELQQAQQRLRRFYRFFGV